MKNLQKEKVWDPVSRLWHWVFAAAVTANWILGTFMSFYTVRWHFYVGYLVLALLGFRLFWGIAGPAPARFGSFFPSRQAIARDLSGFFRREPGGVHGHSALGALSIYAMLLVIAGQAITGLFIEADDYFEEAPLFGYVTGNVSDFMNAVHHTLPDIILILVVLHVAAIIFYLIWKRENLIMPMIHGWKRVRRP